MDLDLMFLHLHKTTSMILMTNEFGFTFPWNILDDKRFFSFFPLIYFYYPNKNRNKKNSTQTHMYLIFLYKSFRWKEGKKVLIVGDCISDIELFNISLLFSIIFLCSLLLTGRKNFFFATQQNKKLKLRSKSFLVYFWFFTTWKMYQNLSYINWVN